MQQHNFGMDNRCSNCNASREQVDDNVVAKNCLPAERDDASSAGEHGTRIGTVYIRSKLPISADGRAAFMRELAERIELNTLAGRPWPWKLVNGTTLMIEIDAERL